MKHRGTPWKFVLLGGDRVVAANYMAAAARQGYHLDHFSSMHELGYLGRFREYDAAIVHHEMQPLSGLELAEYLEKLFQSLPMVLLTTEEELNPELLPASIVECLPVRQEPRTVLDRAMAALAERKPSSAYLTAVERG